MKLKKKVFLFPNGNKQYVKYILFFIFLCSAVAVQGQLISITASDASGAETVNPPANVVQFTVRKGTFPFSVPDITVNYSISGSATNGDDYDELFGTVEVSGAASAQTTIINVPIRDDQLVEGTEDITLTLEPGLYTISGTLGDATASIIDNDIGTFSLQVTEPNAAEENQVRGRYVISLDLVNATGGTISVPYTLSPAVTNGADASDYTTQGQTGSFTFPNEGQLTRALNIIPVDDSIPESDETVVMTLGTPTSNLFVLDMAASSGSVVIADNDCSAGEDEPKLNNNSTDFCDVTGVDLNDFYDDDKVPAGAQLRWSLVENPAVATQLLTTAAASNAPANTYYAIFWSAAEACASPSDGPLTITINQSPEAGTAATGLFSCNVAANGATTFDLDTALTGADPGGDWSNESGPGGDITVPASGIVDFNGRGSGNYVFRYTVTGSGACADDFVDVTISVSDCDPCIAGNVAPAIDPATPRVFCGAITVNLNDYTNSTPPAGTVLRWSLTAPTDTVVPAAVSPANPSGGTYYGYFFDSANDCASPALQVIITQNTAPMITNTTGGTRCGPGPVPFTAAATGNATFNWYTSATGGTVAFTGANTTRNLSQTTTYYLVATENGCPTSPRVPVTGTVQVQPSTGTPVLGISSCNDPAFGTTTLDLDVLLTDEDAGGWTFTSGPANVPIDNQNIVDFSTRPDGDYVYTFTTSGAQAPCANESVEVSISVSSCDTDADGDGLLGGLEAALGTDPNDVDSDNDLINDDVEVGPDTANPLDQDGDGIIDALDSNLADSDGDGVVDQLDPANNNACIPDNTNSLCDEPIDLEVLKVIDNPNADVGTEVTFTITVNNLGPRAANTIVIGDFLESGFEYKSHIPSRGAYDQETGQWKLADLASETSATLSITVTVVADENQVYSNTAELLSSDPLDSNPDNDSSTVTLGVDKPEGINLIVEKTARLGPDKDRLQELTGLINDIKDTLTVEYFIKVINKSQAGSVANINVRDVFETDSDIEFEITDAIVPDGSGFVATTGIWSISRNLEVDDEIELSYTVVFKGAGTVVNTAQIISPQNSVQENTDDSSSVRVEITTRNELEIGILYNQFSPNSDGINDVLKVNRLRKNEFGFDELVDIEYSIDIYNRYGTLVYEATGLTEDEAWDGTWKGKQVPDGTYFYGLNVTIIEGEQRGTKTSKGWIQLIR